MIMVSKNDVRVVQRRLREQMSEDDVIEHSEDIARLLPEMIEFLNAKVIALYAAANNEIFTEDIEKLALRYNKRVCYPRVNKSDKSMTFHFASITDLHPAEYKILAPKADTEEVNIADIDLIFVPSVALTMQGDRLGYGGGYYDRFLKKLATKTTKVGLCHDENLLYSIPSDPQDEKMDYVISETGIYRAMPPRDKMVLENTFLSTHGCFDQEKEDGVTIYVKAELLTDFRYIQDDELSTAVDYPLVMEVISHHATFYSADLLETVAENMAKSILKRFPQIYEIDIEIQKKNADIGLFSVQLKRCQNEYFI